MAGERLGEAEVDWQGIEGDRQFAFFGRGDNTRFPWLTGRELPKLVLHSARFRQPASPKSGGVEVTTPRGVVFDLHDPALLEHLGSAAGFELGLMQSGRGLYDAMPLSITTSAALAGLDATHGQPLDARRFRFNIVVESDAEPREWLGRTLAFGEGADRVELFITNEIPRCAMITISPDDAQRDPAIMRTVASSFGNLFGVYATPAKPGHFRVDDPVFVLG